MQNIEEQNTNNSSDTIIITNKISPLKHLELNQSLKDYADISLSAIKKQENKNDISDTSMIMGMNYKPKTTKSPE